MIRDLRSTARLIEGRHVQVGDRIGNAFVVARFAPLSSVQGTGRVAVGLDDARLTVLDSATVFVTRGSQAGVPA